MSKIIFTRFKAMNFRSIGNTPVELFLNVPNSLVCSRENGSGKSTMMTHLLTYGLYDKPYGKGQKKSALVNSKSGKSCLVEIDFTKNGSKYTVRRGMKPTVFDIIQDGVRIDDEASLKDYQSILRNIVGIDERVFYNTVILGKDKFVPFVEMSAADRRNYIEQVLDLDVFSNMNLIAKEDYKELKTELQKVSDNILHTNSRLYDLQENLTVLTMRKEQQDTDNSALVNNKRVEIEKVQLNIDTKQNELQGYVIDNKIAEDYNALSNRITTGKTKVASVKDTIHKIKTTTECPTCFQYISNDSKAKLLGNKEDKLADMVLLLRKLESEHKDLESKYKEAQEKHTKMQVLTSEIRILQAQKASLSAELNAILNNTSSVDDKIIGDCLNKIASCKDNLETLKQKELELTKKTNDYNVLLNLLKDEGIKARIIERYIPQLNKTVNDYLNKLGLFVTIIIDNEFNITMYSPTRKGQGVQDLSSGQVRRIDLALLLAWRDIAAQRSSVDSNILVLDETLENLSAQGVNDFLQFYNSTYNDEVTLFVVTQRKDEFSEYFDSIIEFGIKDDFTYLV